MKTDRATFIFDRIMFQRKDKVAVFLFIFYRKMHRQPVSPWREHLVWSFMIFWTNNVCEHTCFHYFPSIQFTFPPLTRIRKFLSDLFFHLEAKQDKCPWQIKRSMCRWWEFRAFFMMPWNLLFKKCSIWIDIWKTSEPQKYRRCHCISHMIPLGMTVYLVLIYAKSFTN